MLWKAVKEILEIAGYNIASIEQEFILDSKDSHIAEPPSGVAGSMNSCTSFVSGGNQVAKNNEKGGHF
jgi:hypothetical protein